MIWNGSDLIQERPIRNMLTTTKYAHGTSYGLSEIGYDIRCSEDISFSPNEKNGKFRLASSIEYFEMPDYLCANVCDKSTWARKGISVFNTLIKPGWRGYLTLELTSCTDNEISIPKGSAIAQIIFQPISVKAEYTGVYQDQEHGPQQARMHKDNDNG